MKDSILLGIGKYMIPVPPVIWRKQLKKKAGAEAEQRLTFMTGDHHRVRDYVVMSLPRTGQPLPPAAIARDLELPLTRVNVVLSDLERNMVFLYRCGTASVVWAYPVTVEPTPHEVLFANGDRGYAA